MRKIILIICGVILLLSAVILFILKQNEALFFGPSNEELAIRAGGIYYETGFYRTEASNRTESELKEYLAGFSESGFIINLENLLIFNNGELSEYIDRIVNKRTNEPCNVKTTLVSIFPKEPFGETDYTIKVTLDCD